jgi:hypothetical protein
MDGSSLRAAKCCFAAALERRTGRLEGLLEQFGNVG